MLVSNLIKAAALALLLAAGGWGAAVATEPIDPPPALPWVVEHFDALVLLQETWDSSTEPCRYHARQSVHFIRAGAHFGDRMLTDDMRFSVSGGMWVLEFDDYYCAHRVIYAPLLITAHTKSCDDLRTIANAQPWFGARRNMRALRDPDPPPKPGDE